MRIGLVCPFSYATLGGVQSHTLLLGQELQKQGVEVVFISPTPTDFSAMPQPHVQVGLGVNLPNFNGSWSDYTYSFSSTEELTQMLQAQNLDLLHVESPVIPFINWQLISASMVPVVVTLHSGWEKDAPLQNWLFFVDVLVKQLKPKIVQSIAVSQTAAVCERYLVDDATAIIPNPVDLAVYQVPQPRPKNLTQDKFNLLFVGRLDQRKGMTELLQALSLLPKTDLAQLKVWVIGDGPLAPEVKALAKELKLSKVVKWLGRQPESVKIAYLQHASALAAPSLAGESFGMVLTEAMACGLPIICGNNRGYLETLQNYPAPQLVVDPKDDTALAAAIMHLQHHPKLGVKLKKWALQEVQKYAVEKVAQKHVEVYEGVLNRRIK